MPLLFFSQDHLISNDNRGSTVVEPRSLFLRCCSKLFSRIDEKFQHIRSPIISGIKQRIIRIFIWLTILLIALKSYKNLFIALHSLKELAHFRSRISGQKKNIKYVAIKNQYFWGIHVPGWPSVEFNKFIENELNKIKKFRDVPDRILTIIFAITKKCTLRCEHCFAWKTLNNPETLSLNDLKYILGCFQNIGITHVQFSGGEPLLRCDDLLELLNSAGKETFFSLLTSGEGLTIDRAIQLRQAGLKSVIISLDHWDPSEHNRFRNCETAYESAINAVYNARKAGLLVSLCLCPTKDFLTEENLWIYFKLAKKLKVGFLRILEPRAAGHYSNIDVELSEKQLDLLDKFYIKANSKKYSSYPAVAYIAYHQRRLGCFGRGDRFLNIDADGNVSPCPFNDTIAGNCLSDSIEEIIKRMQKESCHCRYIPAKRM